MIPRIPVYVLAYDPVSEAGVVSALRYRPEVEIVQTYTPDRTTVAVVVADAVDARVAHSVRAVRQTGKTRAVVVATILDPPGLLAAIEARACGLLRRSEATPDRLVTTIRAAAKGDGTMPPDLLGRLLEQVGRLQRETQNSRGISLIGLSERERQVLRLVADGHDTAGIARTLAYSERTVKNIIHDITSRLQLRNRTHAVAYAVREGLI